MLTYEKVIEIFEDYLAADHEEEVLRSRRGYVRVSGTEIPVSVEHNLPSILF